MYISGMSTEEDLSVFAYSSPAESLLISAGLDTDLNIVLAGRTLM